MNIHDFEAKAAEGDMLCEIFTMQSKLHEKYMPIEVRNKTGLAVVEGRPFDIDDRFWQVVCKDFSYRVTEELTESFEAFKFYTNTTDIDHKRTHGIHTAEELIDALHFMTEYMLIIGVTPLDIAKHSTVDPSGDLLVHVWEQVRHNYEDPHDFGSLYFDVILYMGTATNLLKLRPWKTTHMVTDVDRFRFWMIRSYIALIRLLKAMFLLPHEIHAMYTKKNSVNSWRIGSGY